ncbi:hypothetical protein DFJ73DRAFT_834819 [Zopfochytrium polystomum]|nr:hypothetical protein DFJ73DRAFT_834819 [Zopfochytrium polystomum]
MANSSVDDGLYLLDYGAGNVLSLVNAVKRIGYSIKRVERPEDIAGAKKIIFPGVGAFGAAMEQLDKRGFRQPLLDYIASGRPLFGICVGLQCLFQGSEESPEAKGLGVIPATIKKFNAASKAVPHMGWNGATLVRNPTDGALELVASANQRFYFVHSFAPLITSSADPTLDGWAYTWTRYGEEVFVSSVMKGNVLATQFHPEKSGYAGLRLLKAFLENFDGKSRPSAAPGNHADTPDLLSRRIIACLDVRANDAGDLVVTKGDQYDVRDRSSGGGDVRNLGKPVDLARRYFEEGADEVTFLNITSFRDLPFRDLPMLEVLRRTSESVTVPALEVADEYFRSGADKVSIGSDAVYAAEAYLARGKQKTGDTAIEQIAYVYGAQAVVISVDPRRVYVRSPEEAPGHDVIKTQFPGPNGEEYVWYQCTVKGGREGRDLDVRQLITACEDLGAGEILCNCMDKDGTNSGFDHELLSSVKSAVSIPVIASSGAGKPSHFTDVFAATNVEAALAAGIFHRGEVPISAVKEQVQRDGFAVRAIEGSAALVL